MTRAAGTSAAVQRGRHVFGTVVRGTAVLTVPGQIAAEELAQTANVRPDLVLSAWVVFPRSYVACGSSSWASTASAIASNAANCSALSTAVT